MSRKKSYWSIADIRCAHENRRHGGHWFEPGTIRFFQSRISETTYCGRGGVFFVSSEKPPHGPRRFTVRRFVVRTWDIDTVGPFCESTSYAAHQQAKQYAKTGVKK